MAPDQEMHSFHGSSPDGTNRGAAPTNLAEVDADRAVLLRLGKKQVLKVVESSWVNEPSKKLI